MFGRYASYWNAFLFGKVFAENRMKMKESRDREGATCLVPPWIYIFYPQGGAYR